MTPQANPHEYSLQSRLLLAFSILLFIFLGLTGVVLDRAFRTSVEAGAADRLQFQILLILAAVEQQDGEFYFLEDLREPRFGQLDSGLYGFISQNNFGELWRSESARAFTLQNPELLREPVEVGDSLFRTTENDRGEEFFALSYGILWEDGISEYSFTVIEDVDPYYSEISNFRRSLWSWLGGVAVLLLVMQFVLLRWGLSPLKRMVDDLKRIESGQSNQLASHYPRELQGVTQNLNLLIETERKQQERYRTTLGDLAHSLKTPLAVISGVMQEFLGNSSAQGKELEKLQSVSEQVERMNQIVSYQLQRAVQSRDGSLLARRVNIGQSVDKVLDALSKVYADNSVQLEKDLDESVFFRGDERDLMELLGNILDNGFKYCRSRLKVVVRKPPNSEFDSEIVVVDDGPGIPEDKQEFVLQRGARADSLLPGQGIGLAVVADIVDSYGGEVVIDHSDWGGARITIRLIASPGS
ncbi:MAG: ATP-binding protein [Gammaproteobacteria bacterium]